MPDEYISREAALKYIKSEQCGTCSDIGLCGNCAVLVAVKLLAKVPAADVAEVVQCKDCKHKVRTDANGIVICSEEHGMYCPTESDFCRYGEYRTNTGGVTE